MCGQKANHKDTLVNDRNPNQVEKEITLARPTKNGGQDKALDESVISIASDQGFVYYEE